MWKFKYAYFPDASHEDSVWNIIYHYILTGPDSVGTINNHE